MPVKTLTPLTVHVTCGEKTCASEPGQFCVFFGSVRFGTKSVCRLFPSEDHSYTKLEEDYSGGWIQRRTACLNSQK
jgi:hypothetical protein